MEDLALTPRIGDEAGEFVEDGVCSEEGFDDGGYGGAEEEGVQGGGEERGLAEGEGEVASVGFEEDVGEAVEGGDEARLDFAFGGLAEGGDVVAEGVGRVGGEDVVEAEDSFVLEDLGVGFSFCLEVVVVVAVAGFIAEFVVIFRLAFATVIIPFAAAKAAGVARTADFDHVGLQRREVADEGFFEFAAADDEFFLLFVEEVGDVGAAQGQWGWLSCCWCCCRFGRW